MLIEVHQMLNIIAQLPKPYQTEKNSIFKDKLM